MSSETRTTALALANEYAGTHANNTPEQVIERAGRYEQFLLAAPDCAAEAADTEVTGSLTCDYRPGLACIEISGPDSEGQLEITVQRRDESAFIYLGAWKARRLASLLLAGADAIEADRG